MAYVERGQQGIQCDGCGVFPITGPRFKSKVKDDYDLCSIYFSKIGNKADYIRMDRPVHYRHPWCFRASNDHIPRVGGPALPHVLRNRVLKSAHPKLESCFILDINVLDETVMAPSTPFTKIWRMRNNDTLPWSRGAQLVWIGGDKLRNAMSVDIEDMLNCNVKLWDLNLCQIASIYGYDLQLNVTLHLGYQQSFASEKIL